MTRVVVVEDHTLVRQSLVKTIRGESGFEVAGDAGRFEDAIELIDKASPDMIVLDVELAGEDGFELAARVRKTSPEIRILFLTMHDDESSLRRALNVGIDGFVPKSASTEEFLEALRAVASGGSFVSPSIARQMLDVASGRIEGPASRLSEREFEIVSLLVSGARPNDIAEKLFISPKTVKNHLTAIYSKLGVKTAAQAVAEAHRLGIARRRH